MKKYLALLVSVMLLVCAGASFAATDTSGHGGNTPIVEPEPSTPVIVTPPPVVDTNQELEAPTPSTDSTSGQPAPEPAPEDSGSEEAKTVEAAVAETTVEEVEEVVVDITEEVVVPQLAAADVENLTTETNFEAATQTAEDTAAALEVKVEEVTEEQTAEFDNILNEDASSTEPGAEEKTDEEKAEARTQKADDLAQKMVDSGLIVDDESGSTKQTWSNMIESFLTAVDEASSGDGEAANASFTVFLQQASAAISQLADNENKAMENLGISAELTATEDDIEQVEDDPDDEFSASDANEFAQLVAAQETQAGNKEAAQNSFPTARGAKMRVKKPAVASQKIDTAKDTRGKDKKMTPKTLRIDRRPGMPGFRPIALDTTVDGNAVLLNSAGNETDHIPGNNEYETSASTGEEVMLIPGYTKVLIYMIPSVDYTPYLAMDAAALNDVAKEEVTSSTQTVVTGQETQTQTVSVPVYHSPTAGYSTSFDATMKAAFTEAGYKTTIGRYIIPGDAGVWSATEDSGDVMLNAYSRAVVRTLPKMHVSGDSASTEADYIIRIRYTIPLNNDKRIVSGDDLLEFYPNGLTRIEDGKAYPNAAGEAKFLAEDGETELTDEMVMQIARGDLGEPGENDTQTYVGYVVMKLAKQEETDTPYRPVIVVKRADVVASEPKPGEPTNPGEPTTPVSDPGSSGGGCDAGFSALALAVLGGFIAARKK